MIAIYTDNKAYIRTDEAILRTLSSENGVRQGCVLSPLLFVLYRDWIIKKVMENRGDGVTIGGRKISNLKYVDGMLSAASVRNRDGRNSWSDRTSQQESVIKIESMQIVA